MTALVLGATVATRWFTRGAAWWSVSSPPRVATGQLVFLPLLATLTERYGWRVALPLLCVRAGVAAVAVLLVMRDRPSDVGLRPFGDDGTEPCRRRRRPHADHGGGARRAARCRKDKSVLDPVRHLLHLRRLDQRADPDASDSGVRRPRHSAGAGRRACSR